MCSGVYFLLLRDDSTAWLVCNNDAGCCGAMERSDGAGENAATVEAMRHKRKSFMMVWCTWIVVILTAFVVAITFGLK